MQPCRLPQKKSLHIAVNKECADRLFRIKILDCFAIASEKDNSNHYEAIISCVSLIKMNAILVTMNIFGQK